MPIDTKELRRLHEAAGIPELGSSIAHPIGIAESDDSVSAIPKAQWFATGQLAAYLCNHVPEILAALEDREEAAEDAERLRWLARTGCYIVEYPRGQEVRDCDRFIVGRGETSRAAIDAARRGGRGR